jgi:hypothetical protein
MEELPPPAIPDNVSSAEKPRQILDYDAESDLVKSALAKSTGFSDKDQEVVLRREAQQIAARTLSRDEFDLLTPIRRSNETPFT